MLASTRLHARRVAAVVGLGQAERSDDLALGQTRQVLDAMLLGAVRVDRVHDQRRLHAQCAAVAAVDAFHLASNETVRDRRHSGTIVALDRSAQHAQVAHLVEDLAMEELVATGQRHSRHQLVGAVLSNLA